MNHSFVFVLLFTCFSFDFCGCFALCCFFLNILFLFCVFVLCVCFFCISVLAFSGVFLFPTRVFLFWGLGFRFSLLVSVLSLLLSAFEFCGLSVSCNIEYTRRRFEAKSPRANGLMQESHTAKYDNLRCKICTGYTISIYRSTRVSSTSFSPSFGSIDLFTDTATILNLLALRSIMGCPGGMSTIPYTRLVFTRAFRANFSISFPRKRL